jgi:hypothetical protein
MAVAALFGGCAMDDDDAPAEAEVPNIELVELGQDGAACFRVDGADALQCFQSEAEADAALLASVPADDPEDVRIAAVPGCVHTSLDDSGWTDHLRVTNTCSYAVRLKVVLAYGPDFPCYTLQAGYHQDYSWGYPKRFDGLRSC